MNRYITLIAVAAAFPVFIWCRLDGWAIGWSLRLALSVLIISPVAEEIIFRGVIQDYLTRKLAGRGISPLWGVAGVSVLFALLHFAVRGGTGQLLVFFPSLMLGYHYLKHKSLPAVIILHAYYNIAYFL